MTLHDEVTQLVLDRVSQSAREMSEKATIQLKKKCPNEEFLNEEIINTTNEQIAKKLKVLNQSFRYSSSYDKLTKLRLNGGIVKSTYRPSGCPETDMTRQRLDAKHLIKERLERELAELTYTNEQLMTQRTETCQTLARRVRQAKPIQDDGTCRDKGGEHEILAMLN